MKRYIFIIGCFVTLNNFGQGFVTSTNWSTPNGGKFSSGKAYGFNGLEGTAIAFSDQLGSQTWSMADLNGDKLADLVITAQLQGGNVTSYSPISNQYWNVYFNNGNGFSTSPTKWTLPDGGKISGGLSSGFDKTNGVALQFDNPGSQTWTLMDMNGDSKLDLLVMAQLQAGKVTCFSPGANQYWKVYLNSGNGFANTAINWKLPSGGLISGGNSYGFNGRTSTAAPGEDTGSQSWVLTDMDGDLKPELIVVAQIQAGEITCFSPGNNSYWKVYSNSGTGFAATPINWTLPNGGKVNSTANYGFNSFVGIANSSDNTGSQTWRVVDMNGDQKPDLLVTAQLQGGFVTSFSPSNNQYWKVFINSNTGFSTSYINWNLPMGGKIEGGVNYGFNTMYGTPSSNDDTGSQTWSVFNIDANSSPELLVTAQLQGGLVTSFSPISNQYWKVYANDLGNGFTTSAINYMLPAGGKIKAGDNYGFIGVAGSASSNENPGSQTWALMNINNDNIPDLIIAAQLQAGDVTSFSLGQNQYWKVYTSNFVTGIKNNSFFQNNGIVFPNPNNGSFYIKGTKIDNLSIFNETGQVIQKVTLNESTNFSCEIKGLQNGVYFVVGETIQTKIIVIN